MLFLRGKSAKGLVLIACSHKVIYIIVKNYAINQLGGYDLKNNFYFYFKNLKPIWKIIVEDQI
ncbi:hypothetical protein BCY91_01290 [Pelobium manganitolerans]|uniref:Uncharacterized protein n=1 Tax=Pelobium manganitolerans TaxID=1842495 RepID=A0A419SBT0_9SPHI|nr:hypothetical protein BCY91_01290 [Pelobium manganitolerans]